MQAHEFSGNTKYKISNIKYQKGHKVQSQKKPNSYDFTGNQKDENVALNVELPAVSSLEELLFFSIATFFGKHMKRIF